MKINLCTLHTLGKKNYVFLILYNNFNLPSHRQPHPPCIAMSTYVWLYDVIQTVINYVTYHHLQVTHPSWDQTMFPSPWRSSWIFCVPPPGTPSNSRTPAPSPPSITCPSPRTTAVAASASPIKSTAPRTSCCWMWPTWVRYTGSIIRTGNSCWMQCRPSHFMSAVKMCIDKNMLLVQLSFKAKLGNFCGNFILLELSHWYRFF